MNFLNKSLYKQYSRWNHRKYIHIRPVNCRTFIFYIEETLIELSLTENITEYIIEFVTKNTEFIYSIYYRIDYRIFKQCIYIHFYVISDRIKDETDYNEKDASGIFLKIW